MYTSKFKLPKQLFLFLHKPFVIIFSLCKCVYISKHNANPQDVQDKLLYEHDIFVRAGNYVSARFGDNFIRVSFSIPTPEIEKFVEAFPKVMNDLS